MGFFAQPIIELLCMRREGRDDGRIYQGSLFWQSVFNHRLDRYPSVWWELLSVT